MKPKNPKTKPSQLVTTVLVAGPWSPWPRDWTRGGSCIWPSVHTRPLEWWTAYWAQLPPDQRPVTGSFLNGYSPRVGPFSNGSL